MYLHYTDHVCSSRPLMWRISQNVREYSSKGPLALYWSTPSHFWFCPLSDYPTNGGHNKRLEAYDFIKSIGHFMFRSYVSDLCRSQEGYFSAARINV